MRLRKRDRVPPCPKCSRAFLIEPGFVWEVVVTGRTWAERAVTLDKGIADVRAYPPEQYEAPCCSGPPAWVAARRSALFGATCRLSSSWTSRVDSSS
jgi:hypothetical protein